MSDLYQQREINEAIQAGNEALRCLENAKDYLSSASNWGLLDIFGGDLLTTFVKHSKMNRANEQIQAARTALMAFQRELHDVQELGDLKVETGDLLGFADYFLTDYWQTCWYSPGSAMPESRLTMQFSE